VNEGSVSGGDQALAFIYLLGCLILVMSGFAVRRAPIGKTLKMALAWVLIFAAGFAVFALREDFSALGRRIAAAAFGGGTQETTAAGELRIAMADDGHFWVDGELNGQEVRFLVDSGATMTTISRETADRVGIQPDGRSVMTETANGNVRVDRGRADMLKLGPIERRDLGVAIARGDTLNVIGMNMLSTLSRWSVENRTLVLRP
jgi:aspartyl protease family protein